MGIFGKTPVEGADPSPDAAGKRRFWAAVLVLDVVFLFVFGGGLVGLLYIRGAAPLARVGSGRVQKPPVHAAPKPAEPAPAPKKEEAPKPPEPPKAEIPKADPAALLIRHDRPVGSPSVHAGALPRHSAEPLGSRAPEPSSAKPAPAAKSEPASSGGKARAKQVEFTHKAPRAKEVLLRGPFLVRTGGKKLMVKDPDGTWRLSISLLPGVYRYSFVIDGKKSSPRQLTVE